MVLFKLKSEPLRLPLIKWFVHCVGLLHDHVIIVAGIVEPFLIVHESQLDVVQIFIQLLFYRGNVIFSFRIMLALDIFFVFSGSQCFVGNAWHENEFNPSMRRVIIPAKELVIQFVAIDVFVVHAEQVIIISHLFDGLCRASRRSAHLLIILILALVHFYLLYILILLDAVTIADHGQVPEQFFVVEARFRDGVLKREGYEVVFAVY